MHQLANEGARALRAVINYLVAAPQILAQQLIYPTDRWIPFLRGLDRCPSSFFRSDDLLHLYIGGVALC